ncbi:YciI family protein [Cytobacillus sp. FJAT-54145]|uniref:YciI family protein n=1 Tax=Cytobacillus spartinae TaxID=3299023 RepID=A0ABW6KCR5_9BACI
MQKLQFLYQLKLIPRLLDEKNWTDKENTTVAQHFTYLQDFHKEGKLILAGRTLQTDPFGIVIVEVETEEEALDIMSNDPAVKEGIMEATLFPYKVALLRENIQTS